LRAAAPTSKPSRASPTRCACVSSAPSLDEAVANIGDVEPTMRTLFELDCGNRLIRAVSAYGVFEGKQISRNTPSEWAHIPPETGSANLLKALCK
jgi:hypothetical protein